MTQENTNEHKMFKVRIMKNNPSRGWWYDTPSELGRFYKVCKMPCDGPKLRLHTNYVSLWIEESDCEIIQDNPEPFMFQGYPLNVGDKLWSFLHGSVTVQCICEGDRYPIVTEKGAFAIDGKYNLGDPYPALFWDNPLVKLPKKPEPKVKKYKVLYKLICEGEYIVSENYYASLEEFQRGWNSNKYQPIQLILESVKEF